MTPLHVGILLAFAACAYWSVGVLVAVVADLIRQGRAAHQGRSWASSSARRSDRPAAAQDQRERQ